MSTGILCTTVSGSASGLVGGFAGGLQHPVLVRLQREYHERYRRPYTLYTAVSTGTLCTIVSRSVGPAGGFADPVAVRLQREYHVTLHMYIHSIKLYVSTGILCTTVGGSAGGLAGGFAGGLQHPVVVRLQREYHGQTSLHSIYRSVHWNPVHHRQRKCRRASWRLCWWFAGSSRSETTAGIP